MNPVSDVEAPVAPYSEDVLVRTFHPDWEMVDTGFWKKRLVLILYSIALFGFYILLGYRVIPNVMPWAPRTMPGIFGDPEEGVFRIMEFSLWFFSTMWYVEIYWIAQHKVKTTKIKWELSHNEEMRVSMVFNKAFGRVFLSLYLFYVLRVPFTFVFGFELPDANWWRPLNSIGIPITTPERIYADIVVFLGFASYSIFIYAFEKTVQGRKYPIFWVIPLIGVMMMFFVPYNYVLITIPFTSTWHQPVYAYETALIVGWLGGIIIPLLYEIMARRFNQSTSLIMKATAKDCRMKGTGFVLLGIAAICSFDNPVNWLGMGGLPAWFELFFVMFLGGTLTIIGLYVIRKAYRPRG